MVPSPASFVDLSADFADTDTEPVAFGLNVAVIV